ncbi:hypothetical protein [Actinotalea subterranea]|uniref:hypothetical protein n=1 Tax=Actinotalea subterranea TaxID=2607497 RepID=UPI0011EEC526|nr:hypothetical protein [Actinotalea subterranea]
MTGMEDEMARARRALGSVSGELDVTWDDVLARAKAHEYVPVLPLTGPRPPRPARVRRVAAAAGLVATLALGLTTGAQVLAGRIDSTPPAGGAVATPDPLNGDATSSTDSAQVAVDRARDALRTAAWCRATLQAADPRTALGLDARLEPTVLDDADGKRAWTQDGGRVTVDSTTGTAWNLESPADLVADRPDLQVAIAALRLLVDGTGTWRAADDDAPDTLVVDVGGTSVVVAMDARTDLPARVSTADPAGTFDISWLACTGSDDGSPTATVPPDGTDGPPSP